MRVNPLLRDIEIVGNHFREEMEKQTFAALDVNDKLMIELEPANPHDPFAVKVLAGGAHVGYIPRTCSAVLHMLEPDAVKRTIVQVMKVEQDAAKKGAAGRRHVFISVGVEE